jgi:hypothetical protein
MASLQQLKDAFLADWNDTSAYEFGGAEKLTLQAKVHSMKYESEEGWRKEESYWESRVANIIMRNAGEKVFLKYQQEKPVSHDEMRQLYQQRIAESELANRIPNGRVGFPGHNNTPVFNQGDSDILNSLVPSKFLNHKGQVNNKAAHVMYSFLHIEQLGGLTSYFRIGDNTISPLELFIDLAYGSHHTHQISEKQVINTFLDVYHPSFRNGFIPIDSNWRKLEGLLGLSTKYLRAMYQILEFKRSDQVLDATMSDWEFDRLYFYALKQPTTRLAQLVNSLGTQSNDAEVEQDMD